jgi:hypothetical protein
MTFASKFGGVTSECEKGDGCGVADTIVAESAGRDRQEGRTAAAVLASTFSGERVGG